MRENKDTLIERLDDIVNQLEKDEFDDATISDIRSKCGEIEQLVRGDRDLNQKDWQRTSLEERAAVSTEPANHGQDTPWKTPCTPPRNTNTEVDSPETESLAFSFSDLAHDPQNEAFTNIKHIAEEAGALVSNLTAALAELKIRREESEVRIPWYSAQGQSLTIDSISMTSSSLEQS